MIKLIAATNNNNVIGNNGYIPWRNVADLTFFKNETTDNTILMGRTTFNSFDYKPLKNRDNFVISRNITQNDRDLEEKYPNLKFFSTVEQALEAKHLGDMYIIGGAQIYEYALKNKIPDEVIISNIDDNCLGDTVFNFNEGMTKNYIFYLSERFKSNIDDCYVERFVKI